MDPKKLSRAISLCGKYSTQREFRRCCKMLPDSILHERSDFKAFVETVAHSER
jgi:hypothetical protein